VRFIEESGLTGSVQISYSNFVELTCSRADEKPDRAAYVFLQDGENESGRLTFAQLDRRARAIAAKLQSMGMTGERALLLYPPGLDYIVGFFGCLYAGVVAVPASPPARRQRSRLLAVINDAAPAVIMTTTDLAVKYRNEFACGSDAFVAIKAASREEGVAPTIPEPAWFATDNLEAESVGDWVKPALNANSLAFLQYTSGSTGDPKGVMVSHGNLMANQKAIKQGFEHTEHTTVVGWLPLYHDMGLIGNLLQPLYLGTTAILMPPMAFLEKPVRWLKAISNYRANTSGGPNFAYDLCLRKVTAKQMEELDLSTWTLAFNGSEPVRDATMENFAEKFADRGFRRESFFPCYGLAEATLFVSGAHLPFEGDAQHAEDKPINRPVSCGATSHHHEIRIVDPETGNLCREGHIGEIRVAGPSIAQGYWNRPEESEHTFRARMIDTENADHQNTSTRFSTEKTTEQAFLRTGDLGFLHNGRLHITGRIKDLIIIRGRNVYPQDIEQALVEEIQALIPDGCVAFSINHEDEEQLIVVAEITRAAMRSGDYEAIAAAMRKILAEVCELAAAECVLVQPGTVLKTSSGKIRRQPCKQMYLENSLPVLFRSGEAGATHSKTMVESDSLSSQLHFAGSEVGRVAAVHGGITQFQILQQALLAVPQAQRTVLITRFLSQKIALLLKIEASALPANSSLRALGLDSLKAVELKHEVDELLGIDAPLSLFLSDDSLEKIAEILSEIAEFTAGDSNAQVSMGYTESGVHSRSGLSTTQFSMWTMQQLEPNSIVYNLHLALRIAETLDQERLKYAFRYLMDRHPLLRTLYRADANNEIIQQVLPTSELPEFFTAIDTSAWTESRLQDDMARRAREPFDLEAGPLFRTTYYQQRKTRSGRDTDGQSLPTETGNILLICVHHIAIDLWSVLILVSELKTIYADLSLGQEPRLNNLNSSYTDFVVWQRQYLKSPSCYKAWTYWQRQLTGELPLLSLPTDRPRPAVADYRGASVTFLLDRDETERLKKLAGQQGVTLFALLLTAYKVLLHRYTYQQDLIVGIPASGRPQARFVSVVGNFVNPLPLRSSPSGNKAFSAYLAEVNGALLGALEHQDFPFSRLVEHLQPERVADHWPIYQTLFVLQQAQAGFDTGLAQLALGEAGEFSDWGTMRAGPLAIQQRVENFDVKLMVAECRDGLQFSFQYRCDLFEKDTITDWAGHFQQLLAGIVADCDMKLDDLPLLSADERNRLVAWNATKTDYSVACCLHRLFEAQVEKIPDQIALIYQDWQLTYRELNARSNRLANALIAAKFGPDIPIGICAERSLEMVVGLLGILKAGCAYLPLDPDYPQERLSAMLNDAGAPLILAQPEFAPIFSGFTGEIYRLDAELTDFTGLSERNPDVRIGDESLAYVLFTSGSTGRPKGVGVPHKGVRNRLLWMQDYFDLDSVDAVLQKTPYTFDVSVWEFFWPLLSGARLVMAAPGDHKDPERLVELIERHAVTTLHFVPSMLGAFLNTADFDRCGSLRRVICSGEALTPDLQKRFYQCTDAGLFNLYGPTEASVDVTVWHCQPGQSETLVPIGRPIANTQVYLLDSHLNPVPAGVAGEIYLGGIQLARGYLNQPGLSAERFVPNPFAEMGERLYRTGDLARYRRNGVIDYLGRIDHQVKIRGFRIELGEIEAVLLQHPAVSEAAVIAREDGPGDKYLAAYWVSNQSSVLDMDVLQDFLKARLPDYMIPTVLMELEHLPLTGNGKLGRKALPAPDFDLQFADQYEAPRNEVEKVLARIWSDVLRIERIGIHDNFFALGGDSILSIQVSNRAHQSGWSVTPRMLFNHQTIAELAFEVTNNLQELDPTPHGQGKSEADISLANVSQTEIETLLAGNPQIEAIYPLSPMQEGMLFHTLTSPGSGIYVMQDRYEIHGEINLAAFREAWQTVVDRNPILRTSFDWSGTRPLQLVQRDSVLPFDYLDWSDDSEQERLVRLEALLRSEQESGFDLGNGSLFRIRIINCGNQRYFCIRSYHHILMDEWCTSPMFLEFRGYYEALSQNRPLPVNQLRPFRDYIAWLESQDTQKAEVYWRDYLQGFSEPMVWGDKHKLLSADAEVSIKDMTAQLSEADTEALNSLARQYRITPNTFVQGALALLLCRYMGRSEVVFGVTVSGRPSTLAGAETMLGLFINALPLRIAIRAEQLLLEWLRELLMQNLEMRQYEYSSLVDIQSWSSIPRSEGELFQHLLTFENAPIDSSLLAENDIINMKYVWNRVHTNYPITFVAIPGRQLSLRITYQTERFDPQDIGRMIGHFQTLLEEMVRHPEKRVGEITMLAHHECRQILMDWNQTNRPYSEPRDIVACFEAQAELTPYAVAAAFQGQALTYVELNKRVNRVAHALMSEGADPETLIALFSERGIDYLVMMLGAFKAGMAYLPLDPSHPDGRIAQVLKESGAAWVLTCASNFDRASDLADRAGETAGEVQQAPGSLGLQLLSRPDILILEELESGENGTENPPKRHGPDNLAFVIFTSGSTGMPKGAMVEYKGMFNNLITKVPALDLSEQDVIAQTAGQCFDISVWQHLTALVCGARIEIFPDEIVKEPYRLLVRLGESGVTVLEAVPSMIQALLDSVDTLGLPKLRWLIACGEAFPPELGRRWMERLPHVKVLNAYGPAECSDDVSYYEVPAIPGEAETIVPIGRPVHNTRLYLLNRWLEPVPVGVPGEICVAGIQVGRGYLDRPDLTAEKFIPDPFDETGCRMYRTGDLGRYREDGAIEFLGRIDHQVKIRGVRIEPGEIEAQLLTFPNIERALVTVLEGGASGKMLVAYVVCGKRFINNDVELFAKLREHLAIRLPDAMMPSAFVRLDDMPLSANGKIDRKALTAPDMSEQSNRAYIAPRNPAEEALAGIWKEVLDIERVGVADNFFDLGGHSLLAVQVQSRIRRIFGVDLTLRGLFEARTVERMAQLVEQALIEKLDKLSDEQAHALLQDTQLQEER
jgi:amino acid adenylation domain-containing protein